MASHADKNFSIKLTRFYMRVIGFWYADNKRDLWVLRAILAYTIWAVVFGACVEFVDLYHCWGDFSAVAYNLCVTMPLVVIILKVIICLTRREAVLELIKYSEKHFWNANYDEFGKEILRQCERRGIVLVCILSCAVQGSVASYVLMPVFENVGKNETDRILPYNVYIDFPTKSTPYFEIIYTIQTLSSVHSGICFFCFDNLMGILNIHVVGQFKILQHRLENLCEEYINDMYNDKKFDSNFNGGFPNSGTTTQYNAIKYQLQENVLNIGEKTYLELKKCIEQHLVLIDYVEKLEYIFNLVVFCQMGSSSILMCLAGFRVFVVKHAIFILHLTSAFSQLLLFTWTCNEIMIHSMAIGDAAYRSRWYMLPRTGYGQSVRQGLILIIIRAQRACYVSAGKFTPMSLQSFNNILSTTLSYLSLMRQMNEGVN